MCVDIDANAFKFDTMEQPKLEWMWFAWEANDFCTIVDHFRSIYLLHIREEYHPDHAPATAAYFN